MRRPLYDEGLPDARLEPDGNKGLWYSHFFNGYPDDWKPDRDKETKERWAASRSAWVKGSSGRAGDKEACLSAALRLHNMCTQLRGRTRIFTGTWHFATGMGLPHPVENGFLWHPTLGTPYLPGAAVKGLVRAWLESWAEFDDDADGKKRWEKLYRWFGSEAKDPGERKRAREAGFIPPTRSKDSNPDTEAGGFIFFDALPVTPPILKADIMTPHMGKWYELGGEPVSDANVQAERTPADWHDPNPVVFLVADKPSFQFAIAPRVPQFRQEISEVMAVLEQALDWLGAGAKTAVGYGQMGQNDEAEKDLERAVKRTEEDRVNKKKQDEERENRKAKLKALDPIDRDIEFFLETRHDKGQAETSALIQAIESGRWQGEEKSEVIKRLPQRMQAAGEWRPVSKKKNPEKDKAHLNTRKVQGWIDSGT